MSIRESSMRRNEAAGSAQWQGAVLVSLCLAMSSAPARAQALKFGNEGVYPPFSMVDSSGKLTGVEPELAVEMCKRMKTECEIVVMDFKALIPSLLQKKFDGITTQLSPTPERLEKLAFGMPIFLNPGTFVVKKDANYTFSKEGFAGKGVKLGLQRGSSMVKYAQDRWPHQHGVRFENQLDDRADR